MSADDGNSVISTDISKSRPKFPNGESISPRLRTPVFS